MYLQQQQQQQQQRYDCEDAAPSISTHPASTLSLQLMQTCQSTAPNTNIEAQQEVPSSG
jgi:phage gp29-like protein